MTPPAADNRRLRVPITVLCCGAERVAAGGLVACPHADEPVPLAECRSCRHLVTRSDDRSAGWECGPPEVSSQDRR
jgi:hypothetical protein